MLQMPLTTELTGQARASHRGMASSN